MKKYRNFRWTLHVNAELWHNILLEHISKHVNFKEVVFQYEMAPTTGAFHYQGFLALKSPYTESSVAVFINKCCEPHKCNVLPADLPDAARKYAQKEETRIAGPWSLTAGVIAIRTLPQAGARGGGDRPEVGPGKRSDIELFRDAIKAGKSDGDLWEEHPSCMARYPRMLASLRGLYAPRRDWKPEVHVYYGAAGTGKSRRANELAPLAYRKVPGLWWDMYNGEPDVIMDDFYGTAFMEYSDFLKFVDYYDYTGQVKGSMVKVNPRRVFITSNVHPSMWYVDHRGYNAAAFFRRITTITQFLEDGSTVDHSPALFAI